MYDEGSKLVSYDPGPYAAEYGGEKVDIIYTNEAEYKRLGSRVNAKLVVIKRGSKGATVLGTELNAKPMALGLALLTQRERATCLTQHLT